MPKVVQEKFQVTFPEDYNSKAEDDHGWLTDMEARSKKGLTGREGTAGGDPSSTLSTTRCFSMACRPAWTSKTKSCPTFA